MEVKKVLLVFNPISGNSDKEDLVDTVIIKTAEKNISLRIYETSGKDDNEAITKILESDAQDRILVAGGDGTITNIAEIIKDFDCSMGIIPAGSANGLAVNFGIPENLEKQIDIALGDNKVETDLLCINGKLSLHIADLGINAELIKNYEDGSIRGKIGYLLQTIPTIVKSNYPFEFEIEYDGLKIQKKGILLAIANANKFGTGANVNPKGKINDGKFEVLIFKNLDFIEIFKTLKEDFEINPEFMEVISTNKVTVSCKTKVPFQIDGEYCGEVDNIIATVLPQKIEIAVPANFNNDII